MIARFVGEINVMAQCTKRELEYRHDRETKLEKYIVSRKLSPLTLGNHRYYVGLVAIRNSK